MEKKNSNLTNVGYQSKFLPLLEQAETDIKKLIVYYALHYKSKFELREKIKGVIRGVAKKIPLDLIDREQYIYGLYYSSEKMIKEFYDKVIRNFLLLLMLLKLSDRSVYKQIKTPLELQDETIKHPSQIKMDLINVKLSDGGIVDNELKLTASPHGFPNVEDYPNALKKKIKQLAETQSKAGETDTTPTSLWSKAERDLRHESQLAMIEDLKQKGVRYAWTSSHANCSKRCSCWQGKLFDLTATNSELSNHRMRSKVNGNTVYCFNEVISQVDKYGYQNNIITGFGCRHRLIPYTENSVAPVEFSEKELEENRKVNAKLREYEREIRALKQQAELLSISDKKEAQKVFTQARQLKNEYKQFAQKHGYAYYEWRCRV